ncbi:lipid-transfer protein [Sphingomonas sp. DBB INV C78]|uniref:thiolase C-terminal domain-containing protein n=1 Tax=Sphingomonas sp. DBB INV C78 TaxID=3349434 RepID=UPI0036D32550
MVDRNSQAAIVGIGQTEFSRNSGRSEQQLMAEAVKKALDDAGIYPSEVDGCITFDLDNSDEVDLTRNLGCKEIKYTLRTPQGGASSVTTIVHAKKAVEAGICDVMVVWRAMNERSAYRFGQPNLQIFPSGKSSTFFEWCMAYGAQAPAVWEALSCGPYMNRYGVTSEDLGHIAVLLRSNAATNPDAWFYGKPITLEDHQNSKWIVAPWLHLLDCCQESDGGVALVITRMDRARDTKNKPARILGAEYAYLKNHEIVSDYYEGDLTELAMSERVRERLTQAAGLAPRDTNVAMIYDNFTPQILRQTEAFGYCKPGEAKDYIRDGHMNLDGKSPLSPNGGLMGEAYIHGMNNITEAVRQLRGTAANQVKNVETVFCASGVAGAILGL